MQKQQKYIEFTYLEELNDPGKRFIMYMKNKDGIRFRYSNRMHINRTKRLKYQRLIKNYKDKNEISKTENELIKILLEKYKAEVFRKYKRFNIL